MFNFRNSPGFYLILGLLTPALFSCGGGSSSASGFSGSFITLSKRAGIPANGISTAIIRINLAKENGDPISGQTVIISATGKGNDITQPTQATDENGQTSAQLRSDDPGIKIITVGINEGGDEPLVIDLSTSVHFGDRFGSIQTSATTGDTRGLAFGDIDLDGQADIAVTGASSDNISTMFGKLLGTEAFTFARLDTDGVGADPSSIAMGDIDGDGDLDLLVANATDGTVSVMTNNGFGLFEDLVEDELLNLEYPTIATGANPVGIVASDFNGDGFADFATVNNNADANSQITIALADGSGSFKNPKNLAAGTTPVDIALGDFNANGSMDLVVVNNGDSTVMLFRNDGSGVFSLRETATVANGPLVVAVGDLNEDGFPDVVTGNDNAETEWISRLTNTGKARFEDAVTIPGATGSLEGVALADVDGDSSLDLIFTDGDLNILFGDGTGVFEATPDEFSTGGGNPDEIIAADFNNDTFIDIVVLRTGDIGYFTLPRLE